MIAIESGIQHADLVKMSLSFCSNHEDDTLRLYCYDCKALICLTFFAEIHTLHNCSNIEKAAEEFTECLSDDLKTINEKISLIVAREKQISEENTMLLKEIY